MLDHTIERSSVSDAHTGDAYDPAALFGGLRVSDWAEPAQAVWPTGQCPARDALGALALEAVQAAPHQLLPNEVIRELVALAAAARIDLPLTEAIDADTFMGRFPSTVRDAAGQALRVIDGTLYARYYGIARAEVSRHLHPSGARTKSCQLAVASDPFAELCTRRAHAAAKARSVARNGTIIEQQQILTTHNLATLFATFDLADQLGDALDDMARMAFEHMLATLATAAPTRPARCALIQSAAIAWRQMIFLLSMRSSGAIEAFFIWARGALHDAPRPLGLQVRPLLDQLAHYGPEYPSAAHRHTRVFLGWTTERHWLI